MTDGRSTGSLGVPASSGGRAATASQPSPQAVSGIAGIPNAALCERLCAPRPSVSAKPTVHELEKMLANDGLAVEIQPDGQVAAVARLVNPDGPEAAKLIRDAWGALNFILAFYEPGQRYLDTEAWKRAEAGGRAVHARLASAMSAFGQDPKGLEAKPASAVDAEGSETPEQPKSSSSKEGQ